MEEENAKLKKLLADQMPEASALRAHLQADLGLSERRACSIVAADRKMIRHRSRPAGQGAAESVARPCQRAPALRLPAAVHPAGQGGEPSGINRIYRLCREEGLTVRKRRSRRRAVRRPRTDPGRGKANARWSLDFVHDKFACGRRFRILNVVDDVRRECLAAIPDTSISGRRVARELTDLIARRGSRA